MCTPTQDDIRSIRGMRSSHSQLDIRPHGVHDHMELRISVHIMTEILKIRTAAVGPILSCYQSAGSHHGSRREAPIPCRTPTAGENQASRTRHQTSGCPPFQTRITCIHGNMVSFPEKSLRQKSMKDPHAFSIVFFYHSCEWNLKLRDRFRHK